MALQDSHEAGERIPEAQAAEGKGLLSRGFVLGSRAGLERARTTGRGAMLLFVASW